MIPFIDLNAQQKLIREKIDKRINEVLDHGQYILGPEVKELSLSSNSLTSGPKIYCPWSRTFLIRSSILSRINYC